jgi:ABC-type antimicrobial peptide transport system permease subunit
MVLRQGMVMAVAGMAAGGLVAVGASRLISSQLYEVSPADPWAYALAAGALVTVALAACLIPARRATKVDPMVALHYE